MSRGGRRAFGTAPRSFTSGREIVSFRRCGTSVFLHTLRVGQPLKSVHELTLSLGCHSFLKDLATLRNPQSGYTFLAYLASFRPSRLVSFISLSTFNPSRREFADYLQWCANKVTGEIRSQGGDVAFGEDVVAVDALRPDEHDEGADVKVLRVTSRRIETGETITRFTRNLVVSAGGSPKFPAELSTPELVASQRVVHTANFLERIDPVLERIVSTASQQPLNRPLRLAVIGAGQSAAECFLHLRSKLAPLLPNSRKLARPQVDLLIRSSALRNTDESQFINEVFDPSMSQAVFRLGEEERTRVLGEAKNTNYSIVNPRTLEAVSRECVVRQTPAPKLT